MVTNHTMNVQEGFAVGVLLRGQTCAPAGHYRDCVGTVCSGGLQGRQMVHEIAEVKTQTGWGMKMRTEKLSNTWKPSHISSQPTAHAHLDYKSDHPNIGTKENKHPKR